MLKTTRASLVVALALALVGAHDATPQSIANRSGLPAFESAADPKAAVRVVIRQGDEEIPARLVQHETVFLPSEANAFADLVAGKALGTAFQVGSVEAAKRLGGVGSVTSSSGELTGPRRAVSVQGFVIDFLRGTTSDLTLRAAGTEVLVHGLTVPRSTERRPELALVRLNALTNGDVRVITSRKVWVTPKASSPSQDSGNEPFEREVLSSDTTRVPAESQQMYKGAWILRSVHALEAGEYAVAFIHANDAKAHEVVEVVTAFTVAQ